MAPSLAADTGLQIGDPWGIGLAFLGLAVFAAVGALSHEHERAFSASLIYLGLGILAAFAIGILDLGWIDPLEDAKAGGARRRAGGDHRALLDRAEAGPRAEAGARGAR